MKKRFSLSTYILLAVVFFGSFLRFFNPLWDNGLFLHPDERLFINASNLSLPHSLAQFLSPDSPLNPHMFYYGSLLLYLYKLASLISPFSLLMTSRLISAFFSSLTITFVFLIARKLFSIRTGILSALIFACSIGSIQYAHFNTTESLLILFAAIITYIDILCVEKKNPRMLILSLVFVGLATATKITGLLYGVSPFIAALILLFQKNVSFKKLAVYSILGVLIAAALSILLTPYQIIDSKTFLIQQSYMQGVTYGTFKPPFVLIYQNTLPYIYQIFHIFPFDVGFISFPLSLLGIFFLVKLLVTKKRVDSKLLFLIAFPLLYFAWAGSWFAKFARYYVLLIPFMAIWAGYALQKFNKYFQVIFILFIIGNALLFMRIYLSENTRIIASQWIYANIPSNAIIATEHWDDALPLNLPHERKTFTMKTLPVYNDETSKKISDLAQSIANSNYIILSSRRVYVSILENKQRYPSTSRFYEKLFSGTLGYSQVYSITNYPFFFPDSFADETFQSYDHPPVLIFKNNKHISQAKALSLLTSE